MNLELENKTVFVTGASGGIGRAMAETIGAEGASLVLSGNGNFDSLEAWVAEQPWSERALAVRADVTQPEEMASAFERGIDRFGRIDACLANAGVWPPGDAPLHVMPEERLRRAIDVNLLGAMWTARAFLKGLEQCGPRTDGHGAALVFTGSTAAEFGEANHCEYAAAKAGLVGLMRSLKNEIVHLDPFGRVNLVQPGWTVTHMARPALDEPGNVARVVRTMPLRQLARAKDIARAAMFLISHAASRHVSGETITVAGGMEGRVQWDSSSVDEAAVKKRLQVE